MKIKSETINLFGRFHSSLAYGTREEAHRVYIGQFEDILTEYADGKNDEIFVVLSDIYRLIQLEKPYRVLEWHSVCIMKPEQARKWLTTLYAQIEIILKYWGFDCENYKEDFEP